MSRMPDSPPYPSQSSSGVVGLAGRTSGATPAVDTARLTLGGSRLPLVGPARIYVCGITPYDVTHLGHAATFVWADVAAAVARLSGADAVVCRNVTDVDDVLTRAAAAHDRYYDEFALHQEYLFEQDMAALRVRRPAHEPRARHHVQQVVQLAAALLARGHAYERDGHVYVKGADVPAAAGLDRDTALRLSAEFGDDPDDERRDDPFDVPLWRPSGESDPAWPSPWGWGRPGWHAECAAMALAVHGASVDVLAGGVDLAYPHHAYQVAMASAATGVTPFARAQLSVGTVRIDGAKMAKSTGNLVLVADLLREAPAAAVRLLLLDRPWREGWDYRPEDLAAATARLDQLYAAAGRPHTSDAARGAVVDALLADLDVPTALSVAEESGGEAARVLLRTLALS
jgi:L-cysteine:1D-myo-inositol 2-amino-2-deoxy-alpha-D-glucopyranoside ligase